MEEKEEKKTFASHPKSQYWSAKNKGKPENYALNSHKKCWFNCDKCGHDFVKTLKEINITDGWCPYCVSKKLCSKEMNCETCRVKSFASHPNSIHWSPKNDMVPCELSLNSHKVYLFDCDKCGHEFKKPLADVSFKNTWCPYCSPSKPAFCSIDKNCQHCFNRSFASFEKSKYWSIKNSKPAYNYSKTSGQKAWFNCDKCSRDFESRISHVAYGSWCPSCKYKTEDKLYKSLLTYYPELQCQVKVDWCKDKKHLPYDFIIPDSNIIIEMDGIQHFKQVSVWKTVEHNRKRDIYKMKQARSHGYSIIRILQEDVLYNRYDWLPELLANIEKIKTEGIVQNIYMCKNHEYSVFDDIDLDTTNENTD